MRRLPWPLALPVRWLAVSDLMPLGILNLIASGVPESTDALCQFCGHSMVVITTKNQVLGQPVLVLLHAAASSLASTVSMPRGTKKLLLLSMVLA